MLDIEPVTLVGKWVRLEPLTLDVLDQLAPIAADREIWRFLPTPFSSVDDLRSWAERALSAAARGVELPFVIIEPHSGRAIGSTRLMDIRPEHRGVEIGYTWLGREWWRTPINSEAKFLLLRHLFDAIGCMRVSLKTDMLNERSQRAIERLGAVREGMLRKHMVVHGGRVRDTVYYSILDEEWPPIRARMQRDLYGSSETG